MQGGAVFHLSGIMLLKNASFSRNKVTGTAAYYGGAYYHNSGTSTLVHTTFSNNSISYVNAVVANRYGGAIFKNSGTLNLQNSILWNNNRGNGLLDELNAGVLASNVLIRGGYLTGKIVVEKDPLFNQVTPDDLTLSACSPAINMGVNNFSTGLLKDLDGKDRLRSGAVDLGAYENQEDRINLGPATLAEGIRAVKYEQQLTASGGSGNYTYTVSYGALPDGLSLSPTGLISGKPLLAGTFNFGVTANDGVLCGNFLYTATIKPGTGGVRMYVNQAATAGMNNGADWENGYLLLTKAITNSLAGDTIWVAKGTYSPGLLVSSYFTLKEGIRIFGGFAGTETELAARDSVAVRAANETILTGNNKSYHVVYNALNLTAATILDGFTISGGRTAIGSFSAAYYGAGIFNSLGKAVFRNLWVKNNTSYCYGGGMYNAAPATFSNIIFENNAVTGTGSYAFGGGVYNTGLATYTNIQFLTNKATNGGGMLNSAAAVTLNNILFKGNIAGITGGGFYNFNSGKPVFKNVTFIQNSSVRQGGAIYMANGTLTISNGVFSQNKVTNASSYFGGALYHYAGTSTLINTTFSNNTIPFINAVAANQYGAAISRYSGTVTLSNSILWGNKRGNGVPDQLNAAITASNSAIEAGYKTGTLIFTTDPQFSNAAENDLSLAPCSPLINMGDNTKVAGISTDVTAAPRIKHTLVDLGAYEFQGTYLESAAQQLPDATQWNSYTQQIVLGENTAYTYNLTLGLLPDGLTLSPEGKFSGEPVKAGDYEFTVAVHGDDVCGSLQLKLSVKAQAPYIIEVLKPYPVPVKVNSGTAFNDLKLVTEVEVVLSDQSHAKIPVTWLPGNYNATVLGIYTLTGTLTTATPEINRDTLTAEAKVAVIDPIYPYIIDVAHLDSIYVLSGTSFNLLLPFLPTQAQVTYDDELCKEPLTLTWKAGKYEIKPGVYRLYADLLLKEEHANPAGFEAYIDVYAQRNIIEVEKLAEVTVSLNTLPQALPLAETVRVTYHDQTTGLLPVTWDKSTYVSSKGGEYPLKGMLKLNELTANTNALQAAVKVIIRRNIVSLALLPAQQTAYGTDFDAVELPAVVLATFDDATQDTIGIDWQKGNYNELLPADYTLQGELLYDNSVDNTQDILASILLTVLPKPLNIVSIAAIPNLTVNFGTAIAAIEGLKAPITVTYDNGTTGTLAVIWEADDYDPATAGNYTFTGTPVLIDGVVNKNDLLAAVVVSLQNKSLLTVTDPAPVSVKYGTQINDIELPEEVAVTYNDQTSGTENTIWNSLTYNPQLEGVYDFIGELALSDQISNPDQLFPILKVSVGPKPLNILSLQQDSITVAFGTPFTTALPLFPVTILATYDNGSIGPLAVTWAEGEYTEDEPGDYLLKGTLVLPEGVVNTDTLSAVLKAIVGNHIIQSVANPEPKTVSFGTPAADLLLPDALTVTFVDGGSQQLPVDWDSTTYTEALPGVYTLRGTLDNSGPIDNPVPVYAEIQVTVSSRTKNITAFKTDTIAVAFATPVTGITFPAIITAVLDDASEVALTANTFVAENYVAEEAGTYHFEGQPLLPVGVENAGNLPLIVNVKVANKFITAIKPMEDLSVPFQTSYDAISLPDNVTVIYNDLSEGLLSVSWQAGSYNGNLAGTYPLNGTLVIPDDIENPKALQPLQNVTVLQKVRLIVSLAADQLAVPYGTAKTQLTFPVTVMATFDDNSTEAIPVSTWQSEGYQSREIGLYPFTGTLTLPENTENPSALPALFNVQVQQRYIIAVAPLDPITVKFGTVFEAVELPATVTVTYNDNSQEDLALDWSAGTYNPLLPGVYNLTGKLVTETAEENKDELPAAISITVAQQLLIIKTVTGDQQLNLPFGTTLEQVITALGSESTVQYTDDTNGLANVDWSSTDFAVRQSGTYTFTGVLSPALNASNPDEIEGEVKVTISAKNIISISQPLAIVDIYGKLFSGLDLPDAVTVTYNDQSTEELPVIWDESSYHGNTLQPQHITGVLQLTSDLTNTTNLVPVIGVTLQKDIESVAAIATLDIAYGTPFNDLALPSTIEVTYNDGSKEQLPVSWTEADYLSAKIGENTLKGTLTLSPATNNTSLQTATVLLKLKKASQVISFLPIPEQVYGNPPVQLTAAVPSLLPVTFEVITGKVNITAGLMTLKGAGEVTLKALQAGNEFFEAASAQQSFRISKALMTLTADQLSRILIEDNPVLSYTLAGFVYNEDQTLLRSAGTLTGQPLLTTTAIAGSPAGIYPITVSTGDLAADNYTFSFAEGQLTITQNEHTIIWDSRGGNTISPAAVTHNTLLIPVIPVRDGYTFYAWYTDANLTAAHNFELPVTTNLNLYADWRLLPMPDAGPYSLLKIADYMVLLGELSVAERQGPVGMKLLHERSHLADKNSGMKLSNWKSYRELKKAIVKTHALTVQGTDVISGGTITQDSDALLTETGLCYSTNQHPTVNDEKVIASGSSFSSTISGLTSGTYYLRAYASSILGTSYGNEMSITIP